MRDSFDQQDTGLNIFFGILLIMIGLFALGSQYVTTFLSIYFLGWILLISGVTEFFYGFFSGSFPKATLSFLGGILAFAIGVILILNPAISAVSFTLMVGILFLVNGTYKMLSSFIYSKDQWLWTFTGGVITFLLGGSILLSWPVSGLSVIGLFIAVELIITGFLLITNINEEFVTFPKEIPAIVGVKGGRTKKTKTKTKRKKKTTKRNK